jgi:hypothetical protein
MGFDFAHVVLLMIQDADCDEANDCNEFPMFVSPVEDFVD